MRIAVYPGSFDPPTRGHLDIAARAAELFDEVIVAVARNATKSGLFPAAQRVDFLREALAGQARVRVAEVDGLVADFARSQGACALVRGVRSGQEAEQEAALAHMNDALGAPTTVLLVARPALAHLSSSFVKDAARHGADVTQFTTPAVAAALAAQFSKES